MQIKSLVVIIPIRVKPMIRRPHSCDEDRGRRHLIGMRKICSVHAGILADEPDSVLSLSNNAGGASFAPPAMGECEVFARMAQTFSVFRT